MLGTVRRAVNLKAVNTIALADVYTGIGEIAPFGSILIFLRRVCFSVTGPPVSSNLSAVVWGYTFGFGNAEFDRMAPFDSEAPAAVSGRPILVYEADPGTQVNEVAQARPVFRGDFNARRGLVKEWNDEEAPVAGIFSFNAAGFRFAAATREGIAVPIACVVELDVRM